MTGTGTSLRGVARGFRWGARPLVPAGAEPHRPPDGEAREFPTAWSRSPAVRALRTAGQAAVLRPVVRAEVSARVGGLDALAAAPEPCLLVANHSSHLDTALLLSVLPAERRSRLLVAAAADYFFDSWWRAVGSALAFGTLPLDRSGGSSATAPLELLQQGWSLLIFPEGTRSPDGLQRPFKTGAARLAQAAGVPVVPVGLRGAYTAMPRGRAWPVPGRPPVSVRFGPAMRPGDGEEPRAFTDRLSAEVRRLVEEDKETWWGSVRRAPTAPQGETAPQDRAAPQDWAAPQDRAAAPAARWRRTWSATEPVEHPRGRDAWSPR